MKECFLHIKNGQVTNPKVWNNLVAELKDGRHHVKVESKKKRSLNQNAFYWGCVVEMVKDGLRELGWSQIRSGKDAHEYLKNRFLKTPIVNEQTGEMFDIVRSTTDLTTVEFNQFLQEVMQFAAEDLNIAIPDPNSQISMYG